MTIVKKSQINSSCKSQIKVTTSTLKGIKRVTQLLENQGNIKKELEKERETIVIVKKTKISTYTPAQKTITGIREEDQYLSHDS